VTNTFKGRLKTADITADTTWTLPTTGGNLAIVASAAGTIVSADISDATSDATANTVVKRGSTGQASFTSSGLMGGPALTVSSSAPLGTALHVTAATNGTGARIVTPSGTYHAEFGDTGSDRLSIARLGGAIVWFRETFTCRIQPQASITQNRFYTLPDADGTTPIVPAYADETVANSALESGEFYWDTTLKKLRVATA
jgi:hypothetical protein